MFWLLRAIAACNVLALLAVCAFLPQNGLPALSWSFLTEPPPDDDPRRHLPCIIGTAILSLGSLLLAFLWQAWPPPCTSMNTPNATPLPALCGWGSTTSRVCLLLFLACSGFRFLLPLCGFYVSIALGVLTLRF